LFALPGAELAATQTRLGAAQFDAQQDAEANRLENLFNLAERDRIQRLQAAQLQAQATLAARPKDKLFGLI